MYKYTVKFDTNTETYTSMSAGSSISFKQLELKLPY